MSGSGLASEGFSQGFMRGYGFVRQDQAQQELMAQRRDALGMQKEQHDLSMRTGRAEAGLREAQLAALPEQQKQAAELHTAQIKHLGVATSSEQFRLDYTKRQARNQDIAREHEAFLAGQAGGDLSIDDVVKESNRLGVPLADMIDPKFQDAAKVVERVTRSGLGDLGRAETVGAFNTFFSPVIRESVGKPNGNGDEIVDASLNRILHGVTPNTAMVDLTIRAKGKAPKGMPDAKDNGDGTYTYTAPMTEGRTGAPNDPPMEIPLDKLTNNAIGKLMLSKAVNSNPVIRDYIAKTGNDPRAKGWVKAHKGDYWFKPGTNETVATPYGSHHGQTDIKPSDFDRKTAQGLKTIDKRYAVNPATGEWSGNNFPEKHTRATELYSALRYANPDGDHLSQAAQAIEKVGDMPDPRSDGQKYRAWIDSTYMPLLKGAQSGKVTTFADETPEQSGGLSAEDFVPGQPLMYEGDQTERDQ